MSDYIVTIGPHEVRFSMDLTREDSDALYYEIAIPDVGVFEYTQTKQAIAALEAHGLNSEEEFTNYLVHEIATAIKRIS